MQNSNFLLSKANLCLEYRQHILFLVQSIKKNYELMERAKAPDNNLKLSQEEKNELSENFYIHIQDNLLFLKKTVERLSGEMCFSARFVGKLLHRFFESYPRIQTLLV